MEPDLRHLAGLITAFRILGEADDSIEPVAVSSLARCARETPDELERNWRAAIDTCESADYGDLARLSTGLRPGMERCCSSENQSRMKRLR
jgi:hypothetical protein